MRVKHVVVALGAALALQRRLPSLLFAGLGDPRSSGLRRASRIQRSMAGGSLIGFITDCEGNFDYWSKCVALSRVVKFDGDGELQFARSTEADRFVFGGDVFDKGPGDIRIATVLVSFKRRHPDRVWLLAGNRDLNKLRLPAELSEDGLDVPQPVPLYPRAPPQVAFRSFLQKLLQQSDGCSDGELQALNTKANRLRWILDHTMTAGGAFELRKRELAIVHGSEPSDEEVVKNFVDSVQKEDGFVWSYLYECNLMVVLDGNLFVHGGVPESALGWVPSLDMRYLSPGENAVCGGSHLPDGHGLHEWVDAMNKFLREGLGDFRRQQLWRDDRSRGGEALMCMTSSAACFRRSVVVESLLQGGMPTSTSPEVDSYLAGGGVARVLCGHKPCGDSPFAVQGEKVQYVHCDTTYSDSAAKDKRGSSVAAVEIEVLEGRRSKLHLRGVLSDGRTYDFSLPGEGHETSSEGEKLVGRRTDDGWWIKAKLADGSYLVSTGDGSRKVDYATRSREELLGIMSVAKRPRVE